MNSTVTQDPQLSYNIEDYYLVCSLSVAFALIAVIICIGILVLVHRTKPRLHTVNHLLVCNTCLASIFYCSISSINYYFLIFVPWDTSDMSCRWRGYFAYASVAGVIYSYLIQAVSRFFFSILSTNNRFLITFKAHYILILAQWLLVFLITLPSIVTIDIKFHPKNLCWVPKQRLIHLAYTIIAYYVLPVLLIVCIYLFIYIRVRRIIKGATTIVHATKNHKLDLEVLRNILTLLGIYLGGGTPYLAFVFTSIRTIYFINLVTLSFTVAVEKLGTVILDREIRLVMRGLICRRTDVEPFDATKTRARTLVNPQRAIDRNGCATIHT